MEKKVAVYNNNTGVIETMSSLLAGEGLKMVAVTGRAQLQELLRVQEIQLLILDVELDGKGWGEGIEMIHDIRSMTTIPIIIISAQSAETAKIMALNAGADDYVTVGYNPLELLARVKSQLRRYTQLINLCESIDKIYRVDGLEINDRNRTVTVDGREVKLTPIEYKILSGGRFCPSARSTNLSGICRPLVRIIPLQCISAISGRRSRAIPRIPDT